MADIELIIKIPENVYKDMQSRDWRRDEEWKAIHNGTLLPKGHGDLIDRTEVIKSLFDYHNGKKTIGQCIDDVPTIIEANKGE